MRKENGYSLLVGGAGMVHINAGLNRLGFNLVGGSNPERIVTCLNSSTFHGVILADNLTADTSWPDQRDSQKRLIDTLAEVEKARSLEAQKVWIITRQQPEVAWRHFASFASVYEVRRVINPMMFASEVLSWLQLNFPLTKTGRPKKTAESR